MKNFIKSTKASMKSFGEEFVKAWKIGVKIENEVSKKKQDSLYALITTIQIKGDVKMVTTIINNEWRIFITKEEAEKAVAKEVRGIKDETDNLQEINY